MKGKDNKGISLIVLIIIIAIVIGIIITAVCLLNKSEDDIDITNDNKQTEMSSNATNNDKTASNKSNASDKLAVYIDNYKVVLGSTTYNELLQNTNFEEVEYGGDSARACINDGYSEINLELKDGKIEWISTYKDNQIDCGYVFDNVNTKFELFGGLKIGMTLEEAEKIYGEYSYAGSSNINDDGTKSKVYYWNKNRKSTDFFKLESYGMLEVSVDEEANIIQNIAVYYEFDY